MPSVDTNPTYYVFNYISLDFNSYLKMSRPGRKISKLFEGFLTIWESFKLFAGFEF